METNLFLKRKQDFPFLIMSHRGFWGGNIIENTIQSATLAYHAGADIVEVDICKTVDHSYYLFHDENEPKLLGRNENFKQLTAEEINRNSVYNSIGSVSGYKINTLEQFLEWLPANRLVNLDRSWEYWQDEAFFRILRNSGKQEQLVLKSPVDPLYLDAFSKNGRGFHYMPIAKSREDVELVLSYSTIDTIGLEVIVTERPSPLIDPEWVKEMQDRGFLFIVNAESLGIDFRLFDGLQDDGALFQGRDWEIMLDSGMTVIQTDWPNFLAEFRQKRG
ncbi:glycerophosphodiester phosphodiesterase family protein [Jeotgalibaca caeni]|uniref:glycerophosphodiester phosphodiesterase family protein n=1 Tax=Jeotgalibaca caeni TaxID=3028623 RepID=UPI00237E784B|nr:glycerophosphodiester phosphodiesterase family protein [Jeotgalibaca caeni]MDE1549196.1 glycerophosphodiester phosphodiesterase family protein [Jeotgalibaca caeni]